MIRGTAALFCYHAPICLSAPRFSFEVIPMRSCCTLVALFVLISAVSGAEIVPVKGEPIKGEIVSVSDKALVYKKDGKTVTTPINEILRIDYRDVARPAASAAYTQIELTDGTILFASKWSLKKRDVELTLLAGPTVKLPLGIVANVLTQAHVEANRRDWKTRVFNTRGRDAIVLRNEGLISNVECTLGEGDETGKMISFAVVLDSETKTITRSLAGTHGLIFKHVLDAKAPSPSCKLLDTLQDVVMVSSVSAKDGGISVTTPAGAKIDFGNEQIARLDYTKGRYDFLSQLTPVKMEQKSNLDDPEAKAPDQWHVYKDTNLNKGPLTLGGVTYQYGLALKPFVELTYDLKGEYHTLSVVIGIDDNVSAAGGTTVIFERDGKGLASETITSEDKKRFKVLTLNIKDVQKLKITVKSDGDFDTSRHLDLADAKVSK
jgi:hypothetical protein